MHTKALPVVLVGLLACGDDTPPTTDDVTDNTIPLTGDSSPMVTDECELYEGPFDLADHGPIAENIMGPMGQPGPWATPEQLETFARGEEVIQRRFSLADGLGPGFNVTFCGACHEKPVFGGSAGLYRNFFIAASADDELGSFSTAVSAGNGSGVVRLYYHDPQNDCIDIDDIGLASPPLLDCEHPDAVPVGPKYNARPGIDLTGQGEKQQINRIGKRNPIPFFGVGLIAELGDDALSQFEDPDDADGDGISGRRNPIGESGVIGRFGVKAQTVSIEGFIRGPLRNHLGITTDGIACDRRLELPVPSPCVCVGADPSEFTEDCVPGEDLALLQPLVAGLSSFAQADVVGPLVPDDDGIPDPELSTDDLFDLVSYSMLLAAPEFEARTEQSDRGAHFFRQVGCDSCHVPRLDGPRGPIPAYSDFLLHDMGPGLDDGLLFGEAESFEFRTQPLWGVSSTGPYLHDGRAQTLDEAIQWHGGEATAAVDAYNELCDSEREDIIEFLNSLGGRSQFTRGLLLPNTPVPDVGDWAGPRRDLSDAEMDMFIEGRELFDAETGISDGNGSPRFNGDSCRACHFEPVIGGAGPRGVNVIRHGILRRDEDNGVGEFVNPVVGSILHRSTNLLTTTNEPQDDATIFELRQTPHLFGLGVIETIADETIEAAADPDDLDGDGISGKISYVDGGRLGRFGHKAQVPNIVEFIRDATFMELGLTLPIQEGLTYGRVLDNDEIPDPELSIDTAELLAFYLAELAPPPRGDAVALGLDPASVATGEALFDTVGCASCHTPSLEGSDGPVPLYSDLLLHEILDPSGCDLAVIDANPGAPILGCGIEEFSANMFEFRTPPLWGVRATAPYMHNGNSDTLAQAIQQHAGEADGVVDAYNSLSVDDQQAIIDFLETL